MGIKSQIEATDQNLLKRFVIDTDEVAFAELVKRHRDLVGRIARSRLSDHEMAKDVVQTVFLLLARKAATLLEHPSIESWLSRAVVLESKKAIRQEVNRSKRQFQYVELSELQADLVPDSAILTVEKALTKLPDQYRRAIELRYSQGSSFEEIGLQLKKSPAAAQRLVSRAIAKLRELVPRDGAGLAVSGSLGPALLVYFGSDARASAAVEVGNTAAAAGVSSTGAAFGLTKTTLGLVMGIILLGLSLLIGWIKAYQLEKEITYFEGQAVSVRSARVALDSPRRDGSAVRNGSLIDSAVEAYLAADQVEFQRMNRKILRMSPAEIENLILDLNSRPVIGPGAKLLEIIALDKLALHSPGQVTVLAVASSSPSSAVDSCRKWAAKEPMEALAWYLDFSQSEKLLNRELWAPVETSWLKTLNNVFNYPRPAELEFSLNEAPEERKLHPYQGKLGTSLFQGIAENNLEIAGGSLERIPEADLMGALEGIGRVAWKNQRHQFFEELTRRYADSLDLIVIYRKYARRLKGGKRFREDFMALEQMVSGAHLDPLAAEELLTVFACRAGPGNFDQIGEWIYRAVPEERHRDRLAKVLVKWYRKHSKKAGEWILNQTSRDMNHVLFDVLQTILKDEGTPKLKKFSRILLGSISRPALRRSAEDLFREKFKPAE